MTTVRKGATLRTKSGCWTCKPLPFHMVEASGLYLTMCSFFEGRLRRKKCDEAKPNCKGCQRNHRLCVWPTEAELVDRRHVPRRKLMDECNSTSIIMAESMTTDVRRQTLEAAIVHHFEDRLLRHLENPDISPAFYIGFHSWLGELIHRDESLQCAISAISASHLHSIDKTPGMQSLALEYYSRSVKAMSVAIMRINHCGAMTPLLPSVIMLYIHGVSILPNGLYMTIQSC
jgi:hypothetical protein